MALSAAPRSIILSGEFKAGIRPSQNVDAPTFCDPQNLTTLELSVPKQEFKKLTSNMTSTFGATLASVALPTESGTIKIEHNTMSPKFLALMLGADLSELMQAAAAVTADTVTTVFGEWTKLSGKYLKAHATGSEITLKTAANVDVDATKYEFDLVNGMIKPVHADAVGVGMKVGYTKDDRTWEQYLAGLAKSSYVQLIGTATERVSGRRGRVEIHCASLAPAGSVNLVNGEYFTCSLEGDLITPTGKSSPWTWEYVTA